MARIREKLDRGQKILRRGGAIALDALGVAGTIASALTADPLLFLKFVLLPTIGSKVIEPYGEIGQKKHEKLRKGAAAALLGLGVGATVGGALLGFPGTAVFSKVMPLSLGALSLMKGGEGITLGGAVSLPFLLAGGALLGSAYLGHKVLSKAWPYFEPLAWLPGGKMFESVVGVMNATEPAKI